MTWACDLSPGRGQAGGTAAASRSAYLQKYDIIFYSFVDPIHLHVDPGGIYTVKNAVELLGAFRPDVEKIQYH